MTPSSPFSQVYASLLASLTFYTTLPFHHLGTPNFHRIARFAPIVGLILGFLLASLNYGLQTLGFSPWVRAALGVTLWVGLTGGLHLDGAMDSADGLAVTDPDRRLAVMADSVTGAFGAMVAALILLLKTIAWAECSPNLLWTLPLVAGWGRWAQVLSIDRYPYLKAEGKGAFHKQEFQGPADSLLGPIVLLSLTAIAVAIGGLSLNAAIGLSLGGLILAGVTGAWFNQRLGGHTGDTYGAVVEWTEALLLSLLTVF
ncbi:MAG: adenosylcobinamide-GDP ribazoletransferase [Prochlorothrix sp.]